MMNIDDILSPKHILLHLDAKTQDEAIARVAAAMKSDPRIRDWERFQSGVLQRCACSANDRDAALCIAHTRTDAVGSMLMGVGRIKEGVAFESGEPGKTAPGEAPETSPRARLFFVIGVPVALAADYLRIIGALARVFRSEAGEHALLHAATPEAFLADLCRLERGI